MILYLTDSLHGEDYRTEAIAVSFCKSFNLLFCWCTVYQCMYILSKSYPIVFGWSMESKCFKHTSSGSGMPSAASSVKDMGSEMLNTLFISLPCLWRREWFPQQLQSQSSWPVCTSGGLWYVRSISYHSNLRRVKGLNSLLPSGKYEEAFYSRSAWSLGVVKLVVICVTASYHSHLDDLEWLNVIAAWKTCLWRGNKGLSPNRVCCECEVKLLCEKKVTEVLNHYSCLKLTLSRRHLNGLPNKQYSLKMAWLQPFIWWKCSSGIIVEIFLTS